MNRSLASIAAAAQGVNNKMALLRDAFLIKEVVQAGARALDYAASLGEVAQQVGVTTRELQVYRALGGQVGITQEDMDRGLSKLTVSLGKGALGAKAQGDAFAALGISLRDANGHVLTAGEALPIIAEKLSKITDPAQRAALEISLFGKAGQKLDTILTGGKEGIEEYTKRAEDMGLILSDDLAKAADEAQDRITELNHQLEANIAGAVAKNAGAILGLANALSQLTIGAINFISQYPRLSAALAGAAVGARIAGVPGAVVGAGGGTVAGTLLKRSLDDSNMDLAFRKQRLQGAVKDMRAMQKEAAGGGSVFALKQRSGPTGGNLSGQIKEVQRQTALLNQAIATKAQSNLPPPVPAIGTDLPDFLAGGGGKARGKKGPRDTKDRDLLRFQDDLARANIDLLRAKQDNLVDIDAIAAIDRQMVQIEAKQFEKSVEASVKAGEINAAQGQQLIELNRQAAAEQSISIDRDALASHVRDTLELTLAANDNERDILQAQESLAMSASERRTIALKLLEMDKEEDRLKQQRIIDLAKIGKATAAEAQAAQDRLGKLDQIYATRGEAVNNQTAGPMESFLKSLNLNAAQINEAFQSIEVQGLQSLEDGIFDAITGAKSLGDAFKNVANSIISDLIRIAIQQSVIRPLGNALGSLFKISGPALGSAGGSGGLKVPGFADGTDFAPGGLALVGERGPEMVRLPRGSQVIPNHMLQASGGQSINLTVNAPGATMETVSLIRRELANAAPTIVAAASNMTTRNLSRQRL